MSKYTTQLRYIVESGFNLGLQDYPIYDETHRKELNDKIIQHYYVREIGFETVGLFKLMLNRTMNEIMPYYNQLYESVAIKFDPLITHNLDETTTRTRDKTNDRTRDTEQSSQSSDSGTSQDTINSKNVASDTPQGLLTIGTIENDLYANEARIGKSDESLKSTNESQASGKSLDKDNAIENENETVNKKQNGYIGDPNEMLRKYRSNILNIDMMIIEELSTLFMSLW